MGGYQYGRGDSTGDDDPRSQGQGGGRRGYGPPSPSGAGGGSRGYGSESPGGSGSHARQQPQQPPQQPQAPGGHGPGNQGYDPYGGSSARPPAGGGGGRRGYGGSSGSHGRPPEPTPDYSAGPDATRVQGPDATRVQDAQGAGVPAPRRSRLEERRAARGGEEPNDASQTRSDRYPESALNGRSTRNGAAARARTGARGPARPTGPVKKTGYHRYFDYPRTGKYGWKHWVPSIRQISGCFLAGFFLVLGLVAFEYETVQIPDPHSLAKAQQTSYTYDDGSTQFAADGPTDRKIVDITQIPVAVQNAVVSQEDKTFWTNPGVSYTGTARALLVDLMGGDTQGGSTITQQYVKQAYLTSNQTTSRKIDEIFISLKLAKKYDKKSILADYMNVSPFGRNTSGVSAGVSAWFGISLAQMAQEPQYVQDSQAAFLAMMVNSPTMYSNGWEPSVGTATEMQDRALATARWKDTLANMLTYKYITPADYAKASVALPKLIAPKSTSVLDAQMHTAALSWLGSYESTNPNSGLPTPTQIEGGGYTVVTTFNQKYMQAANNAVTTQLINQENKVDKATLQAGLAAVDPSTGDLVAFYGGDANQDNYENNATQRTEQAGSSFKLFTLATAFSQGWSTNSFINGASPWPDPNNSTEVAENGGPGQKTIGNDDGSHGLITLQQATDASVNTAFVRLEEQVNGQYGAVRSMAENFGLNSSNMNSNNQWTSASGCNNVRFTLGICFTDPARMADAYSVIPAGGVLHPLRMITKIIDNNGGQTKTYNVSPASSVAVQPNVAAQVDQMLKGVIHNSDGTANNAYEHSGLNMANIAGKTGTGTMDITNQTLTAARAAGYDMNACTNSDGSSQCGTGGVWFDGYSSKLAVSVGISRWQDIKVGDQTVAAQLPVDNIAGGGSAYGAGQPFKIWAAFMGAMQQSTPFAGDAPFPVATANPNQTVMNSPTPSLVPTTPKATQSSNPPTQMPPSEPPTASLTPTTGAPTDTCQPGGLLGNGNNCAPTSTPPSTGGANPTDTRGHGNNPVN